MGSKHYELLIWDKKDKWVHFITASKNNDNIDDMADKLNQMFSDAGVNQQFEAEVEEIEDEEDSFIPDDWKWKPIVDPRDDGDDHGWIP